jgi:hypothetical protein
MPLGEDTVGIRREPARAATVAGFDGTRAEPPFGAILRSSAGSPQEQGHRGNVAFRIESLGGDEVIPQPCQPFDRFPLRDPWPPRRREDARRVGRRSANDDQLPRCGVGRTGVEGEGSDRTAAGQIQRRLNGLDTPSVEYHRASSGKFPLPGGSRHGGILRCSAGRHRDSPPLIESATAAVEARDALCSRASCFVRKS